MHCKRSYDISNFQYDEAWFIPVLHHWLKYVLHSVSTSGCQCCNSCATLLQMITLLQGTLSGTHLFCLTSKTSYLIWRYLSIYLVLSHLTSERSPEESQTKIAFEVCVIQTHRSLRFLEHLTHVSTEVLNMINAVAKISRCLFSKKGVM